MTTETLDKPLTKSRSPNAFVAREPAIYGVAYLPQPIEYPDSDGQPMAETAFQFYPLTYSVLALNYRYRDRPDVYVIGNMFFYYEEGDPKQVVAPDVMVVIGADKRKRRTYKLWEEPKAPDFILEVTSSTTRKTDQGSKFGLYQLLGVTEYFCYDPTGDYLEPQQIVGYRLENGRYVVIPPLLVTHEKVVVRSDVLGIDLVAEGENLHFVDSITGERLRNYDEAEAQLSATETQLSATETQLSATELQLSETETQLAEQAKRCLEEERLRIEEERRRLAAEAKVRELEARLLALEKANPVSGT